MTLRCVVPGCSSNSKTNTHTFHRFPRDLMTRARWVLAVQRPIGSLGSRALVCGRHFEERMFAKCGGKVRVLKNAVPTLYMPEESTETELISHDTGSEEALSDSEPENHSDDQLPEYSCQRGAKRSREAVAKEELVACRTCLAADGRLYPISGSGLEDTLAALAGIEMSLEVGFPCQLCAFCMARLSKCAAFRDSCHRSTALLKTLVRKGSLTLDNIKTIDRQAHSLIYGLTHEGLYHFQTNPVLDIASLNENHDEELPEYAETEYLENDDAAEYLDTDEIEQKIDIVEDIKVELTNENSDANSDADDVEYRPENDNGDVDTDVSEDRVTIQKERKTVKLIKDIGKHREVNSDKSSIKRRKEVQFENILLKNNKSAIRGEFFFKSLDVVSKELNCTIKILSRKEQRQEVEERKRNNKSAYCCELCGKGFRVEDTMKKHLILSHDPSQPLECDACRFRFRSRLKLNKHRVMHRTTYTCNECGYLSRTRMYAKTHSLMHKGKTYKCPHCPVEYDHLTSYYNHIRMRHPGAYEACDECGETFAAGQGMRLHKALAHKLADKPDATLKCAECDVAFSNAKALQKHVELGAGVPHAALWPCAACGDSCGSESALAAHAAEHQAERHHCDKCNKTFRNAESFELHVRRKHENTGASAGRERNPSRSCVCEICGKLCQNPTLLQYHMNGHLSVKPFPCPQCPKAFAHRTALNVHIRVHKGERPFQCEQCPLAFGSRSNLMRHVKHIHLNQRDLAKCVACGKLMSAAVLPLHVRAVHQNQKGVWRKRARPGAPRRSRHTTRSQSDL